MKAPGGLEDNSTPDAASHPPTGKAEKNGNIAKEAEATEPAMPSTSGVAALPCPASTSQDTSGDLDASLNSQSLVAWATNGEASMGSDALVNGAEGGALNFVDEVLDSSDFEAQLIDEMTQNSMDVVDMNTDGDIFFL